MPTLNAALQLTIVNEGQRGFGYPVVLGLLSEEYDTRAHRQLGNTPQAFSHVGLLNTARHLGGSPTTTRA